MPNVFIERLCLRGYKSIRRLDDFLPGQINVFIGQNGAGKSNLLSFFRLLSNMLMSTGNLQAFVGVQGRASRLLFDGPEVTPILSAEIALRSHTGLNEYKFRLAHTGADDFVFVEEKYRYTASHLSSVPAWVDLGAGHREAALVNGQVATQTQIVIANLFRKLITYHFHNTSARSALRSVKPATDNNWFLAEEASNLSSVLYDLRQKEIAVYKKIVAVLQQIIPFFLDFDIDDEDGFTALRWRERNRQSNFIASQASDGTLRAMALVTLLCLPPQRLPAVMFIDEPELGLHPSAMEIISELVHGVSQHCQVFLATQDADMLNQFSPDEIVVVEREGDASSSFNRLNAEELQLWLQDYSMAELWHKNVLGGRP